MAYYVKYTIRKNAKVRSNTNPSKFVKSKMAGKTDMTKFKTLNQAKNEVKVLKKDPFFTKLKIIER